MRDLNEQHILVCVGGGTLEKRYGVFVEVIGIRRCQGRSNGSRRIASSVLTNNLLMSFSSVSVAPDCNDPTLILANSPQHPEQLLAIQACCCRLLGR